MKANISQQEIQQTAVRLGIPDHPFVARRIARAYNLVETNKVNEVSHEEGLYRVHSQCDEKIYTVELNHGNPHCTCPDGERTIFCKHSIASMLVALGACDRTRLAKPNKLVVYDDTFDKRNGAEGFARDNTAMRHSKYGRWIVNDYKVRKGYVVYRSREACEAMAPREHGKLHCACGKKNCRHCKAIRKVTAEGVRSFGRIAPRDDGKRGAIVAKSDEASRALIENECGTACSACKIN